MVRARAKCVRRPTRPLLGAAAIWGTGIVIADWWDNAVSSRLNNPDTGAWVVNGQRTHEADLFGHIEKTHDMSQIVRLILPNEYDPARRSVTVLPASKKVVFKDPRKTEGALLCPARISANATRRLKKVMVQSYGLQYQQDPRAVAARGCHLCNALPHCARSENANRKRDHVCVPFLCERKRG